MMSEDRTLRIPLHGRTIWYHFGFLTVFLFLVMAASGALMSVYYTPDATAALDDGAPTGVILDRDSGRITTVRLANPMQADSIAASIGVWPILRDTNSGRPVRANAAWLSVRHITDDVEFGSLVHSIHVIAANLLVATLLIHLFSALFMLSWRGSSRRAWYLGVALALLTFASAFSGYVLPFDRHGYFSAGIALGYLDNYLPVIGPMIAGALRGGAVVNPSTLRRMFSLHTIVLPLLTASTIIWHVVRVRTTGFSPASEAAPRRSSRSMWIAFATGAMAVCALTILTPAPVGVEATSVAMTAAAALLALSVPLLPAGCVAAAHALSEMVAPARLKARTAPRGATAPYSSHFIIRDLLCWLLLGASIVTAALLSLDTAIPTSGLTRLPVDLSIATPTPPLIRPPWYYLFGYRLLAALPGYLAMAALVGGVVLLLALPSIDGRPGAEHRGRVARAAGVALLAGYLILTAWGLYFTA